eukprot:NODE_983_length_1340_cov_102.437645_g814_i0.p1 GENE.NODE_983_length_1340_cov_102.437645_g814_i0~~NODE_983_length_1340_cov_102.437645_g814_i0.p1  ORF type:complete len:100 (+),score=4.24 NODE_983_length_1340_cov_102.437645_g814_i0:212-511(+)
MQPHYFTYFLIYLGIQACVAIAILEYAFFKCKGAKNVIEERESLSPEFRRYDTHNWTRWKLYPAAMTLLVPRLFFILLPTMVIFAGIATITGLRLKPNQ